MTGAGGNAQEVYKNYRIASNIVKVKVYAKPEGKDWDYLYTNKPDEDGKKLRIQPIEVFYGSMIPMKDNDGNDLFIENIINGRSQFIYVKAKNQFVAGSGDNKSAPTASWDWTKTDKSAWKLPDYTDKSGYYVNVDRLCKLSGGKSQENTGLENDSEFWEYFKNTEEVPVSISQLKQINSSIMAVPQLFHIVLLDKELYL
jgi:hypothetical protein